MRTDTIQIRVRYAETDRMGAVYNSHFFVYFEVARTEYLRKLGTAYRDLEDRGVFLAVVEAHCRYLRPARYDDLLEVITWVDRLRPTRVDFRHLIRLKADGSPVAEGPKTLVSEIKTLSTQPINVEGKKAGFKARAMSAAAKNDKK